MIKNAGILLLLALLNAPNSWAETLKIAFESDWPPFMSRYQKDGGLIPVIVKEIVRDQGMTLSAEWYPWNRAMREVTNGNTLCAGGAYHTEERAKKFIFSKSFLSSVMVIATRKEIELKVGGLSDLKGLRLGLANGYAYPNAIKSIPEIRYIYGRDLNELIQMLGSSRVDAILGSKEVISYLLETKFLNLRHMIVVHSSVPVQSGGLHLICNKSSVKAKEFLIKFNQSLDKMLKTGKIDLIIEKQKRRRKTKFFPSLKFN